MANADVSSGVAIPALLNKHIHAPEGLSRPGVDRNHAVLIGQVSLKGQLADGVFSQVDTDDRGPLALEAGCRCEPDSPAALVITQTRPASLMDRAC